MGPLCLKRGERYQGLDYGVLGLAFISYWARKSLQILGFLSIMHGGEPTTLI